VNRKKLLTLLGIALILFAMFMPMLPLAIYPEEFGNIMVVDAETGEPITGALVGGRFTNERGMSRIRVRGEYSKICAGRDRFIIACGYYPYALLGIGLRVGKGRMLVPLEPVEPAIYAPKSMHLYTPADRPGKSWSVTFHIVDENGNPVQNAWIIGLKAWMLKSARASRVISSSPPSIHGSRGDPSGGPRGNPP